MSLEQLHENRHATEISRHITQKTLKTHTGQTHLTHMHNPRNCRMPSLSLTLHMASAKHPCTRSAGCCLGIVAGQPSNFRALKVCPGLPGNAFDQNASRASPPASKQQPHLQPSLSSLLLNDLLLEKVIDKSKVQHCCLGKHLRTQCLLAYGYRIKFAPITLTTRTSA